MPKNMLGGGIMNVDVPLGTGINIVLPKGLVQTAPPTGLSLQSYKNQMFLGLIGMLAIVGAGFVLFSQIPALLTAGYSILMGALILSGVVFVIVNLYQLVAKSAGILEYVYAVVPYLFLVSVVSSMLALYATYGDIVERDIIKIPLIRTVNNLFAVLIVILIGYHLYHQTHIMDINIIPASLQMFKDTVSSVGTNNLVYFLIMTIVLGICSALLSTMYSQIMYHTTDG